MNKKNKTHLQLTPLLALGFASTGCSDGSSSRATTPERPTQPIMPKDPITGDMGMPQGGTEKPVIQTPEKPVVPKPEKPVMPKPVVPKPMPPPPPPPEPTIETANAAIYKNHPLNKPVYDTEGDSTFALTKAYKDNALFTVDAEGKLWWKAIPDTIIYATKGTADKSDDVEIMVLQDFTETLTMAMFDVV